MTPEEKLAKRVKEFLAGELEDDREIRLYDGEVERLIGIIERGLVHSDNVATPSYLKRLKHNPREQGFHDVWLRHNYPQPGINSGNGILQDLFIYQDNGNPLAPKIWEEVINSRDRRIVATVIQWLGTNVGIGFLGEALEAGGQYRLQVIPRKHEEPTTPGQA